MTVDITAEIKEFVRERLKIKIVHHRPNYGSAPFIEVCLQMDDETISYDTFDLPECES
ncbi:MAG: hypothetical protein RR326_02925 [Stenotrophomonas sp.]